LAGFRYGLGTDYWSYYNLFHNKHIQELSEPGFVFLINFFKRIFHTNSYNGFVFFIALLSIGIKYCYFKELKQPFLALLIYLSLYYLNIETNGIRQGLAISLVFHAVNCARKRNFLFFLFVALASLIHISSVIFFPLWFLCIKKEPVRISSVIVLTIIVIAIRLFFLRYISNLVEFIVGIGLPQLESLSYYMTIGDFSFSEALGILKRFSIILLFIFLYNNKKCINNTYFNLYILGLYAYIIFAGNHQLAHRLSLCWDVFSIPLFADLKIKYNLRNTVLIMALLLILFATYYSSRSGDPVPYKTYILL
jgi:hypothetical protein